MAEYTISSINREDAAGFPNKRSLARQSDGTLWTFYNKYDGSSIYQMYGKKSVDGGASWTGEVQLSSISGASKAAYYAVVNVDSNDNVHVVWGEDDGGTSWGYEQFHYRGWNGSVWSTDTTLTSGSHHHYLESMAVDSGNNLHVAYYEGGSPSAIRYLRKPSGSAWDSQATICYEGSYNQLWPSLDVDKNDVIHVVWSGYYNGGGAYAQVRYTKSSNGGNSWDAVQNLTSNSYDSGELSFGSGPAIACEPSTGYPCIVWHAPSSSSLKQIRHIIWTGSAWSSITDLTAEGTYQQLMPGISFDKDGKTYVFWHGRHSGSTTYTQIRSRTYSGSWGSIVNETSPGTADQKYPTPIFSRWRIDGSRVVNIPQSGWAFIWVDGIYNLKIKLSSDLVWETGPPPVLVKKVIAQCG
jgi:hypothetical protein